MSLNQQFPVSAQVDDRGALEVVYRHRYARSSADAPPFSWPLTKTFGSSTLTLVSSRELSDVLSESLGTTEASYRGKAFSKDFVTVEASITNEPITAHPDFSDWAGTADTPNTDNAIWETIDGVNRFVQFRDDYQLAGITTYLAPEWTFTLEWMSDSASLSIQPGNVYALPPIPNFSMINGLSLLATSVQQEQNGGAWKIGVQLLGAPNWSSDLYS
jgi:hypothetical protein